MFIVLGINFFNKSLRETHKCHSKVPYMTGMNSSEIGSILFTFLSMMVPGLADGISQVMGWFFQFEICAKTEYDEKKLLKKN